MSTETESKEQTTQITNQTRENVTQSQENLQQAQKNFQQAKANLSEAKEYEKQAKKHASFERKLNKIEKKHAEKEQQILIEQEKQLSFALGIIWGFVIIALPILLFEVINARLFGFFDSKYFDPSAILTFSGSILAAVATIYLGKSSLKQNQIFKEENDKSQKELRKLTLEQEKSKILDEYLSYVSEIQILIDMDKYKLVIHNERVTSADKMMVVIRQKQKIEAIKLKLTLLDEKNAKHEYYTFSEDIVTKIVDSFDDRNGHLINDNIVRENSTKIQVFIKNISDSLDERFKI